MAQEVVAVLVVGEGLGEVREEVRLLAELGAIDAAKEGRGGRGGGAALGVAEVIGVEASATEESQEEMVEGGHRIPEGEDHYGALAMLIDLPVRKEDLDVRVEDGEAVEGEMEGFVGTEKARETDGNQQEKLEGGHGDGVEVVRTNEVVNELEEVVESERVLAVLEREAEGPLGVFAHEGGEGRLRGGLFGRYQGQRVLGVDGCRGSLDHGKREVVVLAVSEKIP